MMVKRAADSNRLAGDLKSFAQARPSGWDHEDWINFLGYLAEQGHDIDDPDSVGLQLERERLHLILCEIPGVGPKRIRTLVQKYDTLWNLRQATPEELAGIEGMNRPIAERVYDAVH